MDPLQTENEGMNDTVLVKVTLFLPHSFNIVLGILLRLHVTGSERIKEVEF